MDFFGAGELGFDDGLVLVVCLQVGHLTGHAACRPGATGAGTCHRAAKPHTAGCRVALAVGVDAENFQR